MFRKRLKAVEALQQHIGLPDEAEYLWNVVLAFEGYPFRTSGRGKTPGVKFSYQVKRSKDGQPVDEIRVSRKEKTITRATIELAYRRAKAMGGVVTGQRSFTCSEQATCIHAGEVWSDKGVDVGSVTICFRLAAELVV